MKRFSLIFLSALVVIAASCSKNDPKHPQKDAWVDDLSLQVPIEFGSSNFNVETKAEPVDSTNLADTKFYIWAADTAKTVSWAEDADEEILLRNATATISSETHYKVQFKTSEDEEITYFYPYGSKYNYSFFAYGVQQEDPPQCSYDEVEDGYYANFELGPNDIIYAESHANVKYGTGFNAAYIRKNYANTSRMPHLQFQHLTTALHFQFQVDDAAEGISNPEMVKIDSIVIQDVPTKAKLWVAHKDEAKSGILVRDDDSIGNITYDLAGKSPDEVNGFVDLGCVFLAPQNDEDDDCGIINAIMNVQVPISQIGEKITYDKFSVDLVIKRPQDKSIEDSIKLKPFQAGKIYTVTIIMRAPRTIDVTAGISGWKNDTVSSATTGTVIE